MPKGIYPRTEYHSKRISDGALKSDLKHGFSKGCTPWNKGKKLPQFTGENNPAWKGGVNKRQRQQAGRASMKYPVKINATIVQMVYEDNIKTFGTLTCYICLRPIKFGNDTLEHKVSKKDGGTNNYNNLAVACRNCNSKKNCKSIY